MGEQYAAGLDILDIRPDYGWVHWARTIRVGDAGHITLVVDIDLAKLTEQDRDFIRGIAETVRALAGLEATP